MTYPEKLPGRRLTAPAPQTQNLRIPVSVIIMTKNEARVIARAVESVKDFAEVFVVDSQSEDGTQAIAEAHGGIVVPFVWDGQYPKKKQWCLQNLPFTHDWILYLDADEVVTGELSAEIAQVAGNPTAVAYDVNLDYVFLNHRLLHGHKVSKRILALRSALNWPHLDDLGATNMWEVEGHYQPDVTGRTARLSATLLHHDVDSLFDYFERHNRYSDWEAHVANMKGLTRTRLRGRRLAHIVSAASVKPLTFFLYAYVFRGGFLDGRAGFHYALANSFYYWQSHLKTVALTGDTRVRIDA